MDFFKKYIYIIEFHSVVKKNEIMTCEGKWLQLAIITLSKITWSQKWPRHRKTNTAYIFSYIHTYIDLHFHMCVRMAVGLRLERESWEGAEGEKGGWWNMSVWYENRKEAGGGGEGGERKATGRGWTGRWKREMGVSSNKVRECRIEACYPVCWF